MQNKLFDGRIKKSYKHYYINVIRQPSNNSLDNTHFGLPEGLIIKESILCKEAWVLNVDQRVGVQANSLHIITCPKCKDMIRILISRESDNTTDIT